VLVLFGVGGELGGTWPSLFKELLALLEGVGVTHVGVLVRKLVGPPRRARALPHVQLALHLLLHEPGTQAGGVHNIYFFLSPSSSVGPRSSEPVAQGLLLRKPGTQARAAQCTQ